MKKAANPAPPAFDVQSVQEQKKGDPDEKEGKISHFDNAAGEHVVAARYTQQFPEQGAQASDPGVKGSGREVGAQEEDAEAGQQAQYEGHDLVSGKAGDELAQGQEKPPSRMAPR